MGRPTGPGPTRQATAAGKFESKCEVWGVRVSSLFRPPVHSVQFYERDHELVERLRGIVTAGLQLGNSVLIVATPEHREQLVEMLRVLGVDVRAAVRGGLFTMLDAAETLRTFMVAGRPDRRRFEVTVGNILQAAKEAARDREKSLTVFGEMVALLWSQGKKQAALALENLWNEAMQERAFHLHCAYPRSCFQQFDLHAPELVRICHAHSHVLVSQERQLLAS